MLFSSYLYKKRKRKEKKINLCPTIMHRGAFFEGFDMRREAFCNVIGPL